MRVLYLTGPTPADDAATAARLNDVANELQITTVASPADALREIRGTRGLHALLMSPALPQADALALIVSLRRDGVPIAIVPIVTETQQGFFASAVASGADDVLLLRADTFVNVSETLTRIRQSPHLRPIGERRQLRVLYAGKDPLVWSLLSQVPFVKVEKATVSPDGVCPVRLPGSADGGLKADAVVIDEQPGDAHPLQVVKSVKAQASDLTVVMLTAPTAGDVETAALDLGADDIVVKSGIFRRRLIATLRHVHQRLELVEQHTTLCAREARLRQIVETLPAGLAIVSGDGSVIAINAAALSLVGAGKPTDLVGRTFSSLVVADHREAVEDLFKRIAGGGRSALTFDLQGPDGVTRQLELRGALLERDARGGRGVVAVLQPPVAKPDPPPPTEDLSGKLSEAERAIKDWETKYTSLSAGLASEREGGQRLRQALEAQKQELRAARGRYGETTTALEALRTELQNSTEAHAWERASWDNTRQELQNKLNDAKAASQSSAEAEASLVERAQVDATLEAVRTEHRHTVETLSWERSRWETDREQLTERLRHIEDAASGRAEVEATLETTRADLREATNTLAWERASWETSRRHHEHQIRALEEARGADRESTDRERERFEAATDQLRRQIGTEQRARENAERALEEARHADELARAASSQHWLADCGLVGMNVRTDLEERLRQAQRLGEVGKLAAAMSPDIEALLATIDNAGARQAADLIRQLARFSRKQSRRPDPVDVTELVKKMEPLLARLVGAHLDFQIALGTTEVASAGEDDLEQLLTALVVGVRDLLTVGGAIRLETAPRRTDWAPEGGLDLKSGPTLTITVAAAGYGVQPPQVTPSLEQLARRCGGSLDVFHDGRRLGLQVHIPCFARAGSGLEVHDSGSAVQGSTDR